ncbi:MAG: preprotein translocase subunit SecG [Candidatus Nealsonbacteria bacterium CG_4_9_14_3_um_filter_35_11]|uniref:Protein-export membrane protein SecG n=2 Tax=Candidatus Nealsoniibacteriota TaxID=1817911 RepID=A0A2M7DAY5_9BACT|nr:MAG: preprotein translocase subunit SecG [Candidatus Nealsonbacteria bacterium CG11_big_fil_rev_8_21_14_0_20_35_11]PIV45594.1 MAG: preprotein translocase subunit SecG [Candidatus Nealsonbacteria bacterium CG02_land_8_20_14_3_00_34_20]PIW92492.1 MAG: preprotein translocase subunit SecG [Candidatus Nealsonbacteria bacterium CG_4_8_14_3_um_filter_34_13]PIZ89886.1 MAG: preprotein translocase subunit SecG [Candidatus Nealsonbacteria bacterium CG_4_10_14_0_2_um_filter_35_20]PJA84587.1 MAG: preprot
MNATLLIIQVIVCILLIICILLQQRGTALGSAFGGEGGFYATRRGIQKKLLWLTIFLGVIFIILAIFNLVSP